MNRVQIRNLVTSLIAKHFQMLEQGVIENALLCDDLGADSLDIVELVLDLEDTFKIVIPDDDLEQMQTVGDTITLVERKVNENMDNEQNEQQDAGRQQDQDAGPTTPTPSQPPEDEPAGDDEAVGEPDGDEQQED